ncbi:MOFRL family protein, partial [Ectopseudomonas hydrolytica]|uniref:MOFRL family protein n=1 Tax=Ectopseudomonas hydrolytica TaxID=2493633 RepID=UPI003C2E771A
RLNDPTDTLATAEIVSLADSLEPEVWLADRLSLLSLTESLKGLPGVYALAGDTDGIDGSEDNAGAIMTPYSHARAGIKGLSARDELDNNNGYGYFAALDELIVTGPTRTNVNDFRAILILESPAQ